jgi:hypothetical protein
MLYTEHINEWGLERFIIDIDMDDTSNEVFLIKSKLNELRALLSLQRVKC